MNKIIMGALLALLFAANAHGAEQQQQRRFYDASGNSTGTASTDSQGSTTYYDARGRVVGKASKR